MRDRWIDGKEGKFNTTSRLRRCSRRCFQQQIECISKPRGRYRAGRNRGVVVVIVSGASDSSGQCFKHHIDIQPQRISRVAGAFAVFLPIFLIIETRLRAEIGSRQMPFLGASLPHLLELSHSIVFALGCTRKIRPLFLLFFCFVLRVRVRVRADDTCGEEEEDKIMEDGKKGGGGR